jgi:hypothetical protein
LPCDPTHGKSNALGICECESTKWIGDDCSVQVPVNLDLLPTWLRAIAYSMVGFSMMVIMIYAVWMYRHRKSVLVRCAQPFFLWLVLLGCFISTSTILAMAQGDDGNGGPVYVCAAIP